MKNLFLIFYISIFSLTSSFVLGNSMDDLVWRDGIAYKKFTNIPYSGEVTGEHQGHFKNGKKEGLFLWYWDNGQLRTKQYFKNGIFEGKHFGYREDGTIMVIDNYKNGKEEGKRIWYNRNDKPVCEEFFKDGKQEGYVECYRNSGQLKYTGQFKNGESHGSWVYYNLDGSIDKKYSGTYKDGKKVSN